jgi:hypothetical protein
VPYQLHWEVVAQADEVTLLEVEVATDEEMLLGTELEVEVLDEVDVDKLLLVLTELLELEVTEPLQAAPVTAGTSALVPLFLVPWKPNSTDCPGWIVLFQFKPVAA